MTHSEADIPRIPVVYDDERVYYALQPRQYECFALTPLARPRDEAYPEHIGYGGAAGGGKSHLARCVAAAAAYLWPGSISVIFRRTEREVMENHVSKIRQEMPAHDHHGNRLYSWNGEQMCLTWWNGSLTFFGYLKSEADVLRYQGQGYDVMIFEESTHYSWRTVSWLIGNRLRANVAEARPFVLYPSNPGGIGHAWYKRLFIDKLYYEDNDERPEDYAFVQAKLADNAILRHRDPKYERRLNRLPEPWRSWLRDGDFESGAGAALPELRRDKHLIAPFKVPDHWPIFGAFDWGYRHPWSFGVYAADEDGTIYKLETITGRLMHPPQIVERIKRESPVPLERFTKIVAGHDLWARRRAYGETGLTLFDRLAELGMVCLQADIDRKQGLESLRNALRWQTENPEHDEVELEPRLLFFNTEGNRKCYRTLENMTPNPEDPEDVLKVDADEQGEGGDDEYDETRYAIHTWPMLAESSWGDRPTGWEATTLQREAEEQRRRHTRDEVPQEGGGLPEEATYGELGVWL